MRFKTLATAAAVLLAAPVLAQDGMKELRAEQAIVPKPTMIERYGPDDLRSGELRLPTGKGPFPVAVVIHGGCWLAAFDSRAGTTPLAEALRRRGIAVWNIEYRRTDNPGGGWPGTFQDVAAGVDHLTALAKRYPLDLKRVAIVGHSAGAHLALWAASRRKLPAPYGPGIIRPLSVVAIDGPGALEPFVGVDADVCGKPVIVPLMGGTPAEKPDAYRIGSPINNLPFGTRQLIVEAGLRSIIKPYTVAAQAKGDPVEVLVPPNANHFDIITPGSPNGKAVADWIAANAFARAGK